MAHQPHVVVVGATGFVGSAVVAALRDRGATVTAVAAPRLAAVGEADIVDALDRSGKIIEAIVTSIAGADALVNAAGDPNASSRDESSLMAANALLPAILARAAGEASVGRFVHVSSAVVQGRALILDESDLVRPFSAYSRSKVAGERMALDFAAGAAVVYRPPSVHAQDRRVSRMMARLARSRLSSVTSPGTSPTPQALLPNVADAIAFLALCRERPPRIVIHPSEGLTTSGLLLLLGQRKPKLVPRGVARPLVAIMLAVARVIPPLAANARRVELLWFGQGQAASWLSDAGWRPCAGHDAWRDLGRALV